MLDLKNLLLKKMPKRNHNYKGSLNELNSSLNIEETELYDRLTKIEQMIHSKLFEAKKLFRINYLCEHTNVINHKMCKAGKEQRQASQYEAIALPEQCRQYKQEVNYYDLFWKLFLINESTAWKVNKLYDNVEEMQAKNKEIQELLKNRDELLRDSQAMGIEKVAKKKTKSRSRRDDKSVVKISCPYESCYRSYCSQISLNLHMKLKHNGGNKTQREMYAVSFCDMKEKIWKARQSRRKEPLIPISFAPGYIQEFGMLTGRIPAEVYDKEKVVHKWVEFQVDRRSIQKMNILCVKQSQQKDKEKRKN